MIKIFPEVYEIKIRFLRKFLRALSLLPESVLWDQKDRLYAKYAEEIRRLRKMVVHMTREHSHGATCNPAITKFSTFSTSFGNNIISNINNVTCPHCLRIFARKQRENGC